MSTLDAMYAPGTSSALRSALDQVAKGTTFVEEDVPAVGRVHLEINFGTDQALIECGPERVLFSNLTATCGPTLDIELYERLCAVLPDLFHARGVRTFIAKPVDERSTQVLVEHGGFELRDGILIWEL